MLDANRIKLIIYLPTNFCVAELCFHPENVVAAFAPKAKGKVHLTHSMASSSFRALTNIHTQMPIVLVSATMAAECRALRSTQPCTMLRFVRNCTL